MAPEPVSPTLRAAIFAAVCLALGAGAHLAMSGAAIPTWALVVGGVGAFFPARHAAGRGERGFLAVTALMGGLQVALHVLFSYAQYAAGTAGTSGSMPAMQMPAGMSMPGMAATTAADPLGLHMSCGMLLAHGLSALVCAWWLWRGEAAAHAVIRSVLFRLREARIVAVFAAAPMDDERRSVCPAGPRPLVLRAQWERGAPAERGPPLLSAYL